LGILKNEPLPAIVGQGEWEVKKTESLQKKGRRSALIFVQPLVIIQRSASGLDLFEENPKKRRAD
jgi:hypothetical protein